MVVLAGLAVAVPVAGVWAFTGIGIGWLGHGISFLCVMILAKQIWREMSRNGNLPKIYFDGSGFKGYQREWLALVMVLGQQILPEDFCVYQYSIQAF